MSALLTAIAASTVSARVTAVCDTCGTADRRDYLVSAAASPEERVRAARTVLATEGWLFGPDGDHCPRHAN